MCDLEILDDANDCLSVLSPRIGQILGNLVDCIQDVGPGSLA